MRFQTWCHSKSVDTISHVQGTNLAESSSVDLVHMLEAALISEYHKHVGCKNAEGSGGDGALNRKPPAPPPYFMYIAGGRADQARWVV